MPLIQWIMQNLARRILACVRVDDGLETSIDETMSLNATIDDTHAINATIDAGSRFEIGIATTTATGVVIDVLVEEC